MRNRNFPWDAARFAELDVRDLRAEAHRAAEAYDLLADVAHDLAQDVRADVRLVQIADLLGRARRDKRLDDVLHVRIVDARRELAVRERAGTALAELHVRLRVEGAAPPEALDVLMARVDVVAALEHERLAAVARERQRSEHARRAEADDDGPPLEVRRRNGCRCLRHRGLFDIAVAAQLLQHLLLDLPLELDVEDVDELDGRTVVAARVDSLTHNYHPSDLLRW